jgi:hypothetical protein
MTLLIFGILNIGYGLFKLAGLLLAALMASVSPKANPVAAAMKSDPTMVAWTKFATPVGATLGLALIAFGIGLILMKNWARLGSIIYSMIDIVLVVVGSIVVWPITQRAMEQIPNMPHGMVEGFATIGLVFGVLFGLAYPAVLLFFMTRTNVIEACQPEEPAPQPPPLA